jgi:hypothetical protein
MSSAVPHSAFAAFASRDFKLLTINQCCLTFAVLIQEVLIALSVSNHQESAHSRFGRDHGFFTFSGAVFMGWLYC